MFLPTAVKTYNYRRWLKRLVAWQVSPINSMMLRVMSTATSNAQAVREGALCPQWHWLGCRCLFPRPSRGAHLSNAGQSTAAKQIKTEWQGKLWLSGCCKHAHTNTHARYMIKYATTSIAGVQIYRDLPVDCTALRGRSKSIIHLHYEGEWDIQRMLHTTALSAAKSSKLVN